MRCPPRVRLVEVSALPEKPLRNGPAPGLAFGEIDRLGPAQQLEKPPARVLVFAIDDPER